MTELTGLVLLHEEEDHFLCSILTILSSTTATAGIKSVFIISQEILHVYTSYSHDTIIKATHDRNFRKDFPQSDFLLK